MEGNLTLLVYYQMLMISIVGKYPIIHGPVLGAHEKGSEVGSKLLGLEFFRMDVLF